MRFILLNSYLRNSHSSLHTQYIFLKPPVDHKETELWAGRVNNYYSQYYFIIFNEIPTHQRMICLKDSLCPSYKM